MITIRTRFGRVLLLLLLIFAAKTGYDYYKVFAWRQMDATVISARRTCEYAKKSGSRSLHREYPLCDDAQEIARLIADGYRLWDEIRLRIEAAYEAKPGEKTSVTFDSSLEDAGTIKPGSTIKIRVSSGSAELAIMPNLTFPLLLGATSALLGAYAYVMRPTSRL